MLIGTPLSATRTCLGDGDRRTEELPTFEEGIYTVFCLPLEAGDLSAPVLAPRISLWETSSSPRPLCFIPHVQTKTDATCGQGNLSCVASAFWEHGPFDSAGLRCRAD